LFVVKLFDPLVIGNLTLKKRIVMPPMANDLADAEGRVTDRLIAHYTRRAPGVGLVIVEQGYFLPLAKKIKQAVEAPSYWRRRNQGPRFCRSSDQAGQGGPSRC